jgi:hypothetical protein
MDAERRVVLRRLKLQHEIRSTPGRTRIGRDAGAGVGVRGVRDVCAFARTRLHDDGQAFLHEALDRLRRRGDAKLAGRTLFRDENGGTHGRAVY